MVEVTIDKIGSLGDGLGRHNGQTVFVPLTAVGDVVEASGDAPHLTLDRIVTPSPQRTEPICRHFGTCGGCAFQHIERNAQSEWKRDEVAANLKRVGIDVDVSATIAAPTHSRRRVNFALKRGAAGAVDLGFHGRGSGDVISIAECPILLPVIERHLDDFRALGATLLRGTEEIHLGVNSCENGLDLEFTLEEMPGEDMIAAFVRRFAKLPFVRASANGTVLVARDTPFVTFGGTGVDLPSGAFLQAVEFAEEAMATLVVKHLKKCKRVTDLFSGSGTFAARLARNSQTHAVDSVGAALEGLKSASGGDGLKALTVERRDLFDLPLTRGDLKSYDGICLDPPRAGAAEQVAEIAATHTKRVAYVSCNPVTFARDAAVLVKGGYELTSVTPIDQFVFSPHIEVVGLFEKSVKAKRSIFR